MVRLTIQGTRDLNCYRTDPGLNFSSGKITIPDHSLPVLIVSEVPVPGQKAFHKWLWLF
jgi:hypothetical protein